MGVGLDLIPLNFPLGCGPGPDPPQFSPWVEAWRGVSLVGGSPWQGGLLGGLPGGGCLPGRGSPWQGEGISLLGGLPCGEGVSLAGGSPWQRGGLPGRLSDIFQN